MLKQKLIFFRKVLAQIVLGCFFASNLLFGATSVFASNTLTVVDTLATPNISVTSAHSLTLTTTIPLASGDTLELYFPNFVLNLTDSSDVTVAGANVDYDNSAKKIILTFPGGLPAGVLAVAIAADRVTNPADAGQFIVNAATRDASNNFALLETGSTILEIENQTNFTSTVRSVVLGVDSSNSDGSYLKGQKVLIQIIFSENVDVSGTPRLALNSGGNAFYTSGSGNSILTFEYTVGEGEVVSDLDFVSVNALTLQGGTIRSASGIDAALSLPTPGDTDSLGANKNLNIKGDTSPAPPPTPPSFSSFSITSTSGITNDSTPPIQISAGNNPASLALSCNGGNTWSAWLTYPADNELNTGDDSDFSLTTGAGCTAGEGEKTITAKLKGVNGLESGTASASVTFASAPTSTITLVENSLLQTFSITSGSATLAGSAASASGTIATIEISIQQTSDGKYFSGTNFSSLSPVWLTTSAKDGTFNSNSENWEYRGAVPSFVNGATYIVSSRAKKSNGQIELTSPTKTFRFDASVPDIVAVTAGPSASARTGITSNQTFGVSATGGDDQISFAWTNPASASGDTFYYELNSIATNTIDGTETSTTNAFVDTLAISDGTSYFHVRPRNGNGAWGVERVFIVKYKKSAPIFTAISANAGTYSGGDTLSLTLTFSEPVTSATAFTVYFDSGGSAVIPAFSTPTTTVSGNYLIGALENSSSLRVIATSGTLKNDAGNALVNPVPQTNLVGVILIGARITLDPATTTSTFTLTPFAPGASEMYIYTNGLKTSSGVELGKWISYSATPLTLTASDAPGTYVVKVDFRNSAGKTYATSATLTRLPTPIEQQIVEEQQETELKTEFAQLTDLMTGLAEALPFEEQKLFVALLDDTPEALVQLAEKLQDSDQLHASATEIQSLSTLKTELQNLLQKNDSAGFLARLNTYASSVSDVQINTIFSAEDIQKLLRLATPTQFNALQKYIDSNVLTVSRDATTGTIIVTKKTAASRDSDGDGLSDALELKYGTNPFRADTDGDGFTDGEEILNLGTDPLDPASPGKNIPTKLINIANEATISDPAPLLRGVAPAGTLVKIYAVSENGTIIALGTTTADAENKWIILPSVTLPEGRYSLRLENSAGKVVQEISIVVDLDFILPSPEIFLTTKDTTILNGEEFLVFTETQPNFYGNTYYGSTIVASFQSILTSTSVIADNPQGDFEVRPPRELEKGAHTLIAYAELPDGTRSQARVVKFVVDPTHQALVTENATFEKIFSLRNLIMLILLGNLTYLAWYWFGRREEELVG